MGDPLPKPSPGFPQDQFPAWRRREIGAVASFQATSSAWISARAGAFRLI